MEIFFVECENKKKLTFTHAVFAPEQDVTPSHTVEKKEKKPTFTAAVYARALHSDVQVIVNFFVSFEPKKKR